MIEIYRRIEGKDRLIRAFDSFEDMFRTRHIDERTLVTFGHNPVDRIDAPYIFEDNVFERVLYRNSDWLFHNRAVPVARCRYICYEDFELVTPDRLIGLYREWWNNRPRYHRWSWHHAGRKKNVYGWFRNMRTTHERRWAHAWDDEDFAPKNGFARGRRSARMIPNAWDDYWQHNDKCWKTQSKRRHQWKDYSGS